VKKHKKGEQLGDSRVLSDLVKKHLTEQRYNELFDLFTGDKVFKIIGGIEYKLKVMLNEVS